MRALPEDMHIAFDDSVVQINAVERAMRLDKCRNDGSASARARTYSPPCRLRAAQAVRGASPR